MKILLTYATYTGSTAEVAGEIAAVLTSCEDAGETPLQVDVRPIKQVVDVEGYDAVVIGSAVRIGRVHPGVVGFLRHHAARLAKVPVAHFVVCLTMVEDTEENRCTARGYIDALYDKVPGVRPFSVGLFAGTVAMAKMGFFARWIMKRVEAPIGDFRNWQAIRDWAGSLREELLKNAAS